MTGFEHKLLGKVLGEHGYIRGPFGSALVRSELKDQGVPVYEQQHAIRGDREFRFFVGKEKFKELSRFQVRPDDLIVSCSGTIGRISIIQPGDPLGIISQALLILRPQTDEVLPQFLYYFLSTYEGQQALIQASHGSVQVNIAPRAVVEQIETPVPTIPEQRAIIYILGSLDEKIELNRRMNVTLEESARALFKSWFVDFDPVRAKMEGRQPEGIDVETAALFPDRLVESMLGFIPDGWRVGTLGEIASNPRRSVQPKQMLEGTLYIGLEHMPQRSISLSDWGAATDVESNKYQFFTGELLFGKLRPYFHKVGIAPIDGICSTDVLVITPVADYWWGTVLMLISSVEFVNETTLLSGGTRMPRVNWSDMAHYKIVIPMPNVAQMFSEFVEQVGKLIIRNIHQWHLLVVTRDALLPKLLSGEVRVGQLNVGEYNYE